MVCAMALVCIWGFVNTYFAPLLLGRRSPFGGSVADLSVIVHVHGWTFFGWYMLMVVQVFLVANRRMKLHRSLGVMSVVVVAAMVLTGVVVIAVNMHLAVAPDSPPLFRFFGQVILSTLILFLVFYGLAIRHRRQAEVHKRWMLSAGAVGLGAAAFRILLGYLGPTPLNVPLGILLTNGFIVAGMLYDRRTLGHVHRVYWISLPMAASTELLFLILPHITPGAWIQQVLVNLGETLHFLDGQAG
jgi:hypothetical protein